MVTCGFVVTKPLVGEKRVVVIGTGGAAVVVAPGDADGRGTTIVSRSGFESLCVTGSVAITEKLFWPRDSGTSRFHAPVSSAVVL